MKARPRTEPRRPKLPPILEIDEDGLPIAEREPFQFHRWSSDEDIEGVEMGEWPTDLED